MAREPSKLRAERTAWTEAHRSQVRTALDLAAPVALALAIIAAAAGSSDLPSIAAAARPLRTGPIIALGVVALLRAILFRSEWRIRPSVIASVVLLTLVCWESLAWSVYPRITLNRALAFSAVLVIGMLLAGTVATTRRLGQRLLAAIGAAAGAVVAAGFALWLVDSSIAVQASTPEYPSRFRGLAGGPNSAALLLAIAMPIAASWLFCRGRLRRLLFGILLLAFASEIVASGSRGALAAGFLSLFVVTALAPARRRALLALGVCGALVLAAWISTIPQPVAASSSGTTTQTIASRGINGEGVLPLDAEIGNPWWTHRSGGVHRTLLGTSVRTRAWRGAIDRGLEQPVTGYGFGAEQGAFINRYYAFSSENPENGYIGLFLQIGVAGLAAFFALVACCLGPAVASTLRHRRDGGLFAAGAIGAAAAGLLMGVSQSYFHGSGNIGFLAFWCSLLLAASVSVPLRRSGEP